MRRTVFISILGIFLFVACSRGMDAKIDGSSEENYRKSMESIKAHLTPEQTERLNEALTVLILPELDDEGGVLGALAQLANADRMQSGFLKTVDGKTPRELIAMADERVRERRRRQLEEINAEIAGLEKKKAEYEEDKALLSRIEVREPRFYWNGNQYFPGPVIDIKVTNKSGVPLSRIFFHGTVSTPGRAVPWIDEDFNYAVPGGIENGETKHLTLAPNQFSSWGNREVKDRKDTVFTVSVVNAEDADGRDIAREFREEDEERLETIRERKRELEEKLDEVES